MNTDYINNTHHTDNTDNISHDKLFSDDTSSSNKKLTGEDVGRLMLTDLCLTWEQMNREIPAQAQNKTLFSPEEKANLVASLHTEQDIKDYNIYREIHAALLRMPERFSLARTRAELAFWRLHALILSFHHTEKEHTEKFLEPFLMTAQQYHTYQSTYSDEDLDNRFPGGIAVIQRGKVKTDQNGYYCPPRPSLAPEYCAEMMIDQNDFLIYILYDTLCQALQECYSILTGISLIAKRVQVPMLNNYIQETVPEDDIAVLNKLIEDTPNQITRFLLYSPQIDQEETDNLRCKIKKILPFIDLETLKPTPEAISRASLFLNDITNIYRETGKLFSLLEEVEQ